MKPVLVACGVTREARIAEAAGGVAAVAAGGRADLLEARLETLAAAGARGVASFGLCGALAGELRVGDLLLGNASDFAWSRAVCARVAGSVTRASIHADGTLALTATAKAAVQARTGAAAIDMESHVAARVAARHGLPLLVLRVVSDRADQALPPAFARAMRADGGTDGAAMLRSLLARPGQLPRFIGASVDAVRALAVLRRVGGLLGPGLGFPDRG